MTLQQHFIVEGKYLGTIPRASLVLHGHPAPPVSFGFVCHVCGEVWARAGIDARPFFFFTKPCRKHSGNGCMVPGSMWMPMEPDFTNALSGEVLKREFLLHLDYAESRLCQNQ